MQSREENRSKALEIDGPRATYSVSFIDDGKQILSGGIEGVLRRWRVNDGHEVGEASIRAGPAIYAAALSPDRRWLVCGLKADPYVRVWDATTNEKVLDVTGHLGMVLSIDVSPDSTKFASGGLDHQVFISSIATGKMLRVGPLQHEDRVVGVRFCPNGDARLATATANKSIRVFDSNSGQRLVDIPFPFKPYISSPLAWSPDGHQLISVTTGGAKAFDSSSGSFLDQWSVPGDASDSFFSVVTSHNQKYIAVVVSTSLSFWDASTLQRIGSVIEHRSGIYSLAISPNDDYVVTGEHCGRITLRNLRDILPAKYIPTLTIATIPRSPVIAKVSPQRAISALVFEPSPSLMDLSPAAFEAWRQGDLTRVERILAEELDHPSNSSRHARVLANRALLRSRLKKHDLAIEDAKKSIEIQRCTMGQVAIAVTRAGIGEHDAVRIFDLVFTEGLSTQNNLLLLIKAVLLFECGKHDEAVLRIKDLIDIANDKSTYIAVRAYMHLLLGGMSLKNGDRERAVELLWYSRDVVPPERHPQLVVISLIFGWDFDALPLAVQSHLEQCVRALEDIGDAAMRSNNPKEAIARYSAALSFDPATPASLLVKRSRARGMMSSWVEALRDADAAIVAAPHDLWGYERRHAALHALQRDDEAVETLNRMLSLAEEASLDPGSHCKCHHGAHGGLDHLLEHIIARSGEETVLAWTGKPSSYNSCLPSALSVHNSKPQLSPTLADSEMDAQVAALRSSVSPTEVTLVYDRVTRLPSAHFSNRRLYLPCIAFQVKKLAMKEVGSREKCYRARVSGIGFVEFQTSDVLTATESRKLIFVHPWMRDLRDPLDLSGWVNVSSGGDDSEPDSEDENAAVAGSRSYRAPASTVEDHTRALRLIVRLQQPFRVLLLQQQVNGDFYRVATEHEIIVPGLERRINSARDIRTEVVEVL